MMSIREMYEYIYYKIYKSMDFNMSWGADWRASGVFIALETFIPLSIIFYYRIAFPNSSPVDFVWFFIPGVIIYIIDYYIFYSRNQWREIVKKYDTWPRKKNFIGTLIVWSIIALVIANFILAIHLYDQVNRSIS